METTPAQMPSPALLLDTAMGYQKTSAVKAALDLDFFTLIGDGADTSQAISVKSGAAEKGARVLCDYLVINGFLDKKGGRYSLSPDSAAFLNRKSQMYMGAAFDFLASPEMLDLNRDMVPAVRKGGSAAPGQATVEPENPIWVTFARSMMPMMMLPAQLMAQRLNAAEGKTWKVLDIAAGHGIYGINIAMQNPNATVYGTDWAQVLEVANENANRFGVSSRYHTIPGDAFETDFGSGYDLVLIPNFLHHFSADVNTKFLRKVLAALKPGGRVAIVEFVPNEDRVTPPAAARFSLTMLINTPEGDAYTFREFQEMLSNAGFTGTELHALEPTPESLLISRRN